MISVMRKVVKNDSRVVEDYFHIDNGIWGKMNIATEDIPKLITEINKRLDDNKLPVF